MTRKAIFSEGRTLCVRIAEPHGWEGTSLPPVVRREAGGLMGVQEEGARPPQRACGARPSGGWAIQARTALRGKPGDDAKGDFLGGARSPRPRVKAGRKPWHDMIMEGRANGRWPKRGNPRVQPRFPQRACGARPSKGWAIQARTALRGNPGDDAKGDFLGGARSPRPRVKAGRKPWHDMIMEGRANVRWPKRGNPRVQPRFPQRACGARPSGGWAIQARTALRGKPGDDAKGDFLGGTHSVRPDCRASRMGGNFITAGG